MKPSPSGTDGQKHEQQESQKIQTLNDVRSYNTKSNKGKINSTHKLQNDFFIEIKARFQ
jgi:hypothetical protein